MPQRESNGIRKMLEANVTELSNATRHRDAIVVEKTADSLDRTLRAAEREMAVRTLEFASKKLQQTKLALQRIDQGTYGICQECEQKISPKRLAAIPTASLCVTCQAAADADQGYWRMAA